MDRYPWHVRKVDGGWKITQEVQKSKVYIYSHPQVLMPYLLHT